jgi:hypothetical protein
MGPVTDRPSRVKIPQEKGLDKAACVLMAKVPLAGRVKTRLLSCLEPEAAASLYACFLLDMVGCLESALPGLTRVAYTPPGRADELGRLLPADIPTLAQRGSHLGERLHNLFVQLLEDEGLEEVIALNSDSPTLPASLVEEALDELRKPSVDGVLGPAEDGGYYLIGLKKPCKHIFSDIPWSSSWVLAATLERIEESRLNFTILKSWFDVDDREDLMRLWRELQAPEVHDRAPATKAFLEKLHAEGVIQW